MPEISPSEISMLDVALLALVGVVAAWINTVAGAGSLLLLPALIFSGLPPDAANATNRIGILVSALAAMIGYRRAGLSIGRAQAPIAIVTMIGGAAGAFVATLLDPGQTRTAIVIAMAIMLPLSFVRPRKRAASEGGPGPSPRTRAIAPLPPATAGLLAAFFAIGVYGGFLQAGLGVLVLLYLSLAHRVDLVTANALKSDLTFALTLIAIAMFAGRGERIDWLRGGVLAVSGTLGALLGARTSIVLGERFIRAAISIAVAASMAKLIADGL